MFVSSIHLIARMVVYLPYCSISTLRNLDPSIVSGFMEECRLNRMDRIASPVSGSVRVQGREESFLFIGGWLKS